MMMMAAAAARATVGREKKQGKGKKIYGDDLGEKRKEEDSFPVTEKDKLKWT